MTNQAVKTMFLGAALAAFLLPAAAQSTTDNSPSTAAGAPSTSSTAGQAPASTTSTTGENNPSTEPNPPVYKRKDRQQNRMAKGLNSGSLTPEEANRLEKREADLNRETRRMRAANGGKLTAADKAKLEQQQNQLSQAIHRQKSDAQTMPADTNPQTHINQRKDYQQQRIAEGLKSGNLSPEEAARLQKQQSNIREETRAMRAANNGRLTDAEKAKIQRQQGRASRRIRTQKHDKPGR